MSKEKRKIGEISVETDGNNELITCGKCLKSFQKDGFSNKQYKRYVRGNGSQPNCTSCAKDAGSTGKIFKSKNERTNQAIESNASFSQAPMKDPSLQYLKKPENAPIIHDFKRFFRKQYCFVNPSVHMDKKTRWRTAVKLAVRGEWTEDNRVETHIGLFQPGTHKVIDCTQSVAHHSRINKAVNVVQNSMKKIGITGYIEGHGGDEILCAQYQSFVRYILISVERSSGKVQLTLIWNASRSNKPANQLLDTLIQDMLSSTRIENYCGPEDRASNLFHSIWINHYPANKHCNAIMGREADDWIIRFGPEELLEKVLTDMVISPILYFPPFVFRQANIDGFTSIIQDIREHVRIFAHTPFPIITNGNLEPSSSQLQPIYCLELYGGVGTIGLNCLDYLKKLSCCDENPNNEKCFYKSVNKLLSSKLQVGSSATFPTPICCYATYGSGTVCTNLNISNFDLIIVDPPRKGLDDETLYSLIYPSKSTNLFGGPNKRKSVLFEDDFPVHDPNDSNAEGRPIKHELRRLIYVSCGFEAFKRDCHVLTGWAHPQGFGDKSMQTFNSNTNSFHEDHQFHQLEEEDRVYWKLVYVKGFILFPGSNHIETLAVFDRIFDENC